jgi:uncharacterized membrane protein (UPF0127 family)
MVVWMKIKIIFKNKKISIEVQKCNLFQMFRGLMFRLRENAPALLLFDFRKETKIKIHSLFVFFPFAAVWLDDKNKITEIMKIKPFRFWIFPKKKFFRLIEIPINAKYKDVLQKLEVLRR